MTPVSLSELAAATGGRLSGKDVPINSYSTDTRTLNRGDVYFCLRGDHFDGHAFIPAAIEKGASAIVCEEALGAAGQEAPVSLQVDNGRRAFGLYAGLWRARFKKPVVGITGSNGKTTVKQLLTSIFACAGRVHSTRANDNNEVGVPQTLLGLSDQYDFAVVEMGASGPGEIRRLGEYVQPDISVITNAGAAHLEGFGSAENVADEKAWIYRSLASDGIAVINADDGFKDFWFDVCADRKILTFGEAGDVSAARQSDGSIVLSYGGEQVNCDYHLAGQHNVANAAAAASCAIAAGVSLDEIARGLSTATPVPGRLNIKRIGEGITLIDDTYNANPASTRAAIDVLGQCSGRHYLVLGDLLELGENEIDQHKAIGVYAHENKVDRFLACGELCQHSVGAFGDGAEWFADQQALIDTLCDELTADTTVLVKGSRSMKMEQVVEGVSQRFEINHAGACL